MATEIIAGLGIFKSMLDTAKGLKDLNDAATRNAAVIELQEHILTAQAQQTALTEHISELEKKVARFEAWEAEKQRYELKDYGGGTFAYALKEAETKGEPSHRICAACYQKGHKSILHNKGGSYSGREKYFCPECNKDFMFGNYQPTTIGRTDYRGIR